MVLASRKDVWTPSLSKKSCGALHIHVGRWAYQKGADADHRVFADSCDDGLLAFEGQLQTFALADRVVAEHGKTVLGHEDAGSLVGFRGLAVAAVAARDEHAGEWAVAIG